MEFCWRADDDPTLKAGLVAVIFQGTLTCIARKPYIFVIFQGGGGSGPSVLPLDPHLSDSLIYEFNTLTESGNSHTMSHFIA